MPTPVQGEIKSPQKEKEGINHKEHKGHKEGPNPRSFTFVIFVFFVANLQLHVTAVILTGL